MSWPDQSARTAQADLVDTLRRCVSPQLHFGASLEKKCRHVPTVPKGRYAPAYHLVNMGNWRMQLLNHCKIRVGTRPRSTNLCSTRVNDTFVFKLNLDGKGTELNKIQLQRRQRIPDTCRVYFNSFPYTTHMQWMTVNTIILDKVYYNWSIIIK